MMKNVWFPGVLLELDMHATGHTPACYTHNLERYAQLLAPLGHWQLRGDAASGQLRAATAFPTFMAPLLGENLETAGRNEIRRHREGLVTSLDHILQDLPPILGEQPCVILTDEARIPLQRQEYFKRGFLQKGPYNRLRWRPEKCVLPIDLRNILEHDSG